MKTALKERLLQLWLKMMNNSHINNKNGSLLRVLPVNFSFANTPVEETQLLQNAVYLSPDAPTVLNPSQPPPGKVIVGLLIDRRVQLNRSLQRAESLQLSVQRWPMESISNDSDNTTTSSSSGGDIIDNNNTDNNNTDNNSFHAQEPLNVDTILEALQQWSWNSASNKHDNGNGDACEGLLLVQDDGPFRRASLQAFQHHAQRHPSRPQHRPVLS
jgi:hypothetical protein